MSLIKVLPENVSNRIAAGEVIERPASVVKELVENSIDAKASKIIINIENAGIKSISVIDDGFGMDQDDTLLCLEPHATSKIKTEFDIDNIRTMGFRGEALPSIASVSKFRIRSRQEGMLEGHEVVVNGGKYISESPAGCARGTEIKVGDLFYNTPARRKFLKSKFTEEKHIFETVCLLSLANPEISFELNVDGKNTISSPGDKNLKSRLSMYIGRSIVDSSIFIDHVETDIKISGFISKPGTVKNSRREQRFFVNGRPVRSFILSKAVSDAYNTVIMKGTFPVVTIFITVNSNDIDINVHPAKHEIRFKNERLICNVLHSTIKNALSKDIVPRPSVNMQRIPVKSIINSAEVDYALKTEHLNNDIDMFSAPWSDVPQILQKKENVNSDHNSEITNNIIPDVNLIPDTRSDHFNKNDKLSLPGCGYICILAILDRTYILCSSEMGLVVIDQHAAHERILFERLLKEHSESNLSQQLLIPITIDLSRIELNFIKLHIDVFNNLGFQIELFGEDTILLTAIPNSILMENISGLISDLLDDIINNRELSKQINEENLARAACRHAVKAHDYLVNIEAEELVKSLVKCDLPFSCPHGRPTVINISFKELEKRFGRKL